MDWSSAVLSRGCSLDEYVRIHGLNDPSAYHTPHHALFGNPPGRHSRQAEGCEGRRQFLSVTHHIDVFFRTGRMHLHTWDDGATVVGESQERGAGWDG